MGYIRHDALIITGGDFRNAGWMNDLYREQTNWIDPLLALREEMPAEWQALLIGPIPSIMNSDVSFVFLPDGSKEGWDTSDEGDIWRERILQVLRTKRYDDGSGVDYAHVSFGGDEPDLANLVEHDGMLPHEDS